MQQCWALLAIFLLGLFTSSSGGKLHSQDKSKNNLDGVEASGYTPSYDDEEGDDGGSGSGIIIDDDGLEPDDDEDDDMKNMINETDISEPEVRVGNNEVGPLERSPPLPKGNSVAMASAHGNLLDSTEVVAALIAGGAIGLLFAVLLILLLVYRMRKKDAGSYDLSKKPIYTKAPTNEFYA